LFGFFFFIFVGVILGCFDKVLASLPLVGLGWLLWLRGKDERRSP